MKNVKQMPLISICIPTYNGAKYLKESLDSISSQKYTDFEVVISDDSSSDNTLEICEAFKSASSFPVYIHHHKSSGMALNWNHCIEKSKGTFIKFLFQDDVLTPNCLEKFVHQISSPTVPQLIFCKRGFIVEDKLAKDQEIQNWIKRYSDLAKGWKINLSTGINGLQLIKKSDNLFSYPLNKIGEPTVTFISKSLFDTFGVFDPQFIQLTDVELYYRLLPNCHITYIPEKLVSIRLHEQQTTLQNLENNKADEDLLLYYTLKNKVGKALHPLTFLFPIKYRWKKRLKRWLPL